jgi:hypothetical protein
VAAKLLDAQELGWRARNIDKDLDLIQRYGDKVPVLFHAETKAELAWPFDGEGLERFLGIVA